jgi:DNA primase catalytic core
MAQVLFVEHEVLPKLDYEKIYANLKPIRKGNSCEALCPSCGQKRAFFYISGPIVGYIMCNRRGECGYSGDIFTYLNGGVRPHGKQWIEIAKNLATQAGVIFPENEWSPEQIAQFDRTKKKQQLLNDFQCITKRALASSDGEPAKAYLQGRGWSHENINKYYFGLYLSKYMVEKELALLGYSKEDMISSGICRDDWNGRLIYPMYDLRHHIINFWARDITGAKENDKYKYMSKDNGGDLSVPFNMENTSDDHLIVVEGFFDALTPDANGIKNIISLGGRSLTKAHIETLNSARIKFLILVLDNDKTGNSETISTIHKLKNEDISVYVVNPEKLDDAKDPDEYIQKYGIEKFDNILATKEHGFRCIARDIAKRCNVSGSWNDSELHKAYDEAKKFETDITNPKKFFTKQYFWEEFAVTTGMSEDRLRIIKSQEAFCDGLEKINGLVQNGKIDAAKDTLLKLAPNVNDNPTNKSVFGFRFIEEMPVNFLLNEAPSMPSLVTRTDEYDKEITFIPRGIVGSLVGAGGIGKTHFLTQLAISIITGQDFLNSFKITKPGPVALILGENSYDDIHRLLQKTIKGFYGKDLHSFRDRLREAGRRLALYSVAGMNASFIDQYGNTSTFYNTFVNYLVLMEPEEGWSCIILDPASRFMGPEAEKDNAAATAFISLLENTIQQLKGNPTVLFGHHMSKNAIGSLDTDASASRGASGLTDGVRLQINLEKVSKEDEDKNKIKMKVAKTNHTARPKEQILTKDDLGHLSIETSIVGAKKTSIPEEDQPDYAKALLRGKGQSSNKRSRY